MPSTIAAIDPVSRRRGLLAEVHPELAVPVPPGVLQAFCERLFLRNIRVGLLVTPTQTLVVRDRLHSMTFSVDEYAVDTLVTQDLLDAAQLGPARFDEQLGRQILDYLASVGSSWSSFLPDSAVAVMIPEVVGELAQADLELWDAPLEPDDAR